MSRYTKSKPPMTQAEERKRIEAALARLGQTKLTTSQLHYAKVTASYHESRVLRSNAPMPRRGERGTNG